MEEEEEKEEEEGTDQGDKDVKNDDVLATLVDWGQGDPSGHGGTPVPMLWEYMFSVKLDKVEPLEKYKYYESIPITHFGWLIKEFEDHKLPLSSSAIMFPLVQDYLWRIKDGDKEYEIRKKMKKLNLYSEKDSFRASSGFSFKKT